MTAFSHATGLFSSPSFTSPQLTQSSFCSPTLPQSRFRSPAASVTRRSAVIIKAKMTDQLAVMVNGVPGRMAAATAEEVVRRGLVLADEALTGPGVSSSHFEAGLGSAPVSLSMPEDHTACLQRMREKYPRLVVVDYTHPSAANPNVEKYAKAGLSFVIGTTGGDVDAMEKAVQNANNVYAVIAPNMGKQIVAFQAMMEMMAKEFPGAFAGYKMTVKESHQSTKADTSGTAKSVVSSFSKLGLDFHVEDIEKVREASRSKSEMQVPENFITAGHAFHTYHLTSPDKSVNFEFQHNVCGRGVYAAGTVDAVQFLNVQREKGSSTHIFDMIDILRSGEMS